MKLLLDQNLSPKLIELLKELYPDSVHVSHIGLDQAVDQEVWNCARMHQCTIVTKDADFVDPAIDAEYRKRRINVVLNN